MKLLASLTALALLSVSATAGAQSKDKNTDVPAASSPAPAPPLGAAAASDAGVDVVPVHYPPGIVRLKLIALGLVISGGAWGASFGSGQYWTTVPGAAQLKIPVAGPWIALGKSGCASDDPGCSAGTIGVRGAIYVLDGIAQIAGLALIAEAIVMKTEAPAPDKKAARLGLRFGGVEVTPVPMTSTTFAGAGLIGTF